MHNAMIEPPHALKAITRGVHVPLHDTMNSHKEGRLLYTARQSH